jgi:hypothetical protein
MGEDLSRRQVLVGGTLVVLGGAGGATLVWQHRRDQPDGTSTDAPGPAPSSASPGEAIAMVGAAYLAGHPEQADEATLRAGLPGLTADDPDDIVRQLPTIDDDVRTDFAEDRVVSVDGWVLSLTEARAAALVHLRAA